MCQRLERIGGMLAAAVDDLLGRVAQYHRGDNAAIPKCTQERRQTGPAAPGNITFVW